MSEGLQALVSVVTVLVGIVITGGLIGAAAGLLVHALGQFLLQPPRGHLAEPLPPTRPPTGPVPMLLPSELGPRDDDLSWRPVPLPPPPRDMIGALVHLDRMPEADRAALTEAARHLEEGHP